jgi:membrane-associated phospholipid phosphatase
MKKGISALIRERKSFFTGVLLLVLTGLLAVLFFGDFLTSVPLQIQHSFWPNVFLVNFTFMGDGVFYLFLSLFFIFYLKKEEQGKALIYGFFISSILVQLLKNTGNFSNPTLFFEQGQTLFIPHVASLKETGNFVSGHTATAFAIATILMFTMTGRKKEMIFLMNAMLLGYSRIYLVQDSLIAVLGGALTGTVSGIAAIYTTYYARQYNPFYKKIFAFLKYREGSRQREMQTV